MEGKLAIGEIRIRINNVLVSTEDGSIKEIAKDKFNVTIERSDGAQCNPDQSRFEVLELILNAIKPESEPEEENK